MKNIEDKLKNILDYFEENKIFCLTPKLCLDEKFGYYYQELIDIFNIEKDETKYFANFLFPNFFNKKELINTILICPYCCSTKIIPIPICPNCRSKDIKKYQVITKIKDNFGELNNNNFNNYYNISNFYKCNKCNSDLKTIELEFYCSNCKKIELKNYLIEEMVYKYIKK